MNQTFAGLFAFKKHKMAHMDSGGLAVYIIRIRIKTTYWVSLEAEVACPYLGSEVDLTVERKK